MLGDDVEKALGIIGINKELVSSWIGEPCNCEERKEKLNNLDRWARRVVGGKIAKAREYLDTLIKERNDD